jgi:hypothetical protein
MKALAISLLCCCTQYSLGAIVSFVPSQPLFTAESVNSTSFLIDIDNNGTDDFRFGGSIIQGSVFRTEGANRTLTTSVIPPNATGSTASLLGGSEIGVTAISGLEWKSTARDGFTEPGENSGNYDVLVLCVSTGCEGEFFSLQDKRSFIGVEFEGIGGTHFGFFDVEFGANSLSGRINGWAYESTPGESITVFQIPEPSTMLLALLGIPALCRRKR